MRFALVPVSALVVAIFAACSDDPLDGPVDCGFQATCGDGEYCVITGGQGMDPGKPSLVLCETPEDGGDASTDGGDASAPEDASMDAAAPECPPGCMLGSDRRCRKQGSVVPTPGGGGTTTVGCTRERPQCGAGNDPSQRVFQCAAP